MKSETKTISSFTAAFSVMLVAVAVVFLCFLNFHLGSWSRSTVQAAFTDSRGIPKSLAHIDNLFTQQMPSGNIWVEFESFKPEPLMDEGFMTSIYYRGNYISYPRRVYVSLPSTVVNNGQDMVQQHIVLDRVLIERLGIYWTVTFSQDRRRQISCIIRRIH